MAHAPEHAWRGVAIVIIHLIVHLLHVGTFLVPIAVVADVCVCVCIYIYILCLFVGAFCSVLEGGSVSPTLL